MRPVTAYIVLFLTVVTNFVWSAPYENLGLLLPDGDTRARAKLEMIESAQSSVYSVEFLARDDDFGSMKLALMREKARQGVPVYMHVDAYHLFVNPALVMHLIQAGIKVQVYNKISWSRILNFDFRDHSKVTVVDERMMITGDTNTGNEYEGWDKEHSMVSKDVFIFGKIAKKAAQYARKMFESTLSQPPNFEVRPNDVVMVQRNSIESKKSKITNLIKFFRLNLDLSPDLLVKPATTYVTQNEVDMAAAELDNALVKYYKLRSSKGWTTRMDWISQAVPLERVTFHHDNIEKKGRRLPFTKVDGMDRAVVNFLKGAKSSLEIYSPYMLPPEEEIGILQKNLNRGVRVTLFTNSLETSDNAMTQQGYEQKLFNLLKLDSAQIREYFGEGTWHAKIMIRDNKEIMIMGYNFDGRSKAINLETGVFIKSKEFVELVKADLESYKSKFNVVADHGILSADKIKQQKLVNGCGRFYGLGVSRTRKFFLKVFEFKL